MTSIAPVTVPVVLGDRSYDIVVGSGLLADAARWLKPVLRRPRVVIVTDATVAGLDHLPRLEAGLDAAGISHDRIVLPPGEATKDFSHLQGLMEQLLDRRIDRSTSIVALGGGVIGDIAGFAAAIALRGIDFVQVPTTLLAQVDSSVGGKTAIDTRHGKNLIGAFHQPRLVLADMDVLATLPRRELLAGYAEVAKYGLIEDEPFFAWLEANAAKLLNLGHTFGHALEVEAGFDGDLLHGEAVSVGMVLAFDLSVRLGLCPAADAARMRAHLTSVGLPVAIPRRNGVLPGCAALLDRMRQDKKATDGKLTLILARGIGRSFLARDADATPVSSLLDDALAAA
jgi:3-dehydroquinate synthase